MALAFFLTGYLLKNHIDFKVNSLRFRHGVFALLLLLPISFFYKGNIFSTGVDALFYYPIGILGTAGVFIMANSIHIHSLERLGMESMSVFTFHYLSFKIIGLLKIAIYKMPVEVLTQNPVIHEGNEWFWLVYVIAGVIIPLEISKLKRFFPDVKVRLL